MVPFLFLATFLALACVEDMHKPCLIAGSALDKTALRIPIIHFFGLNDSVGVVDAFP